MGVRRVGGGHLGDYTNRRGVSPPLRTQPVYQWRAFSFGEVSMKLGVIGPKADPLGRTLKLNTIFRALPPIPAAFDVDRLYPDIKISTPVFGNSVYGCCVISARAHQTLRFEAFEQDRFLSELSTKNVTDEYFSESGGADKGLYLLDSLKCWRNGWLIGGAASVKKLGCWRKPIPPQPPMGKVYNIYAFGQLDPINHEDVKATCYLLNGIYIGLALPNTAKNQLIWSVEGDPNQGDSKKFSWGGHCVYVYSYDAEGLWCVTWGQKKRLTWEFWDAYTFEAYGVLDNINKWQDNSPVNVDKLNSYLNEIQR